MTYRIRITGSDPLPWSATIGAYASKDEAREVIAGLNPNVKPKVVTA